MRDKAESLMNAIYRESQQEKILNTRNAFTNVTEFVLENLEDGREKSLVLTKLEEACMWAIKAITREDND
ncbi:MAG: hypothetical protein J6B89_03370 [Bacilli bacterium]|nr:hypothetical protein [Bacilli bacterium]